MLATGELLRITGRIFIPPSAAGELVRAMQHVERREIIHAAHVIAAVAAIAEQNAGVSAHA